MLRSARLQSSIGLICGIVGIFIPLGVILALPAIIFGLVGFYRGLGKNGLSTYFGLVAIFLGVVLRLVYSFYNGGAKESSAIIALLSVMAVVIIFYKHRQTLSK